jgi:hypothetical protein
MEEIGMISNFFKLAERGIQITVKTCNAVAAKMEKLVKKRGLEKIIDLLKYLISCPVLIV